MPEDPLQQPEQPPQTPVLPPPQPLNSVASPAQQPPQQVTPPPTPPSSPEIASVDEPPKPKKNYHILRYAIISLVVIVLVTFIALFSWYKMQLSPRTADDVYHIVPIASGASTQLIAETLEEKQVIKSATAFLWHLQFNGISGLQAGTYRLTSKNSTPEIAQILKEGKVSSTNLLIAPGLRLTEIKQKLIDIGYTQPEIDSAITAVRNHPLLTNVPSNQRLEGYFFPETYKVEPGNTAEQLLELMLDTFEDRISPSIKAGLKKQGLTLEQGIILASIVQKEVSDYPTQQKVAQVFLKRFKEDKQLGSDVTFMYAAAETGKPATPDIDSLYNTRKYTGLPPSAIANFNLTALEAVANPAPGTYNFFVAGDDGVTYFSNTLEEHEALTAQHCKKLCNL